MTLIELMISIALIGILCVGFMVLLIGGWRNWFVHSGSSEVQRDAGVLVDSFVHQIRHAYADTVVLGRHDASQPPYSKASFTRTSESGDKNIMIYQSGQRVFLSEGGAAKKLADNIRCLNFTYPRCDDDSAIEIGLCMERATYEGGAASFYLAIQKVRIMN